VEEVYFYLAKNYKKFLYVLFFVLSFFIIFYPIFLLKNKGKVKGENAVVVEISGAVKKPGVYTLEPSKRIEDLIQLAGGFLEDADLEFVAQYINRAQKLEDGEKIFVPSKASRSNIETSSLNKTSKSSESSSSKSSSVNSLININKATKEELKSLPGIGDVYAQRIIDYRTQNGGFKTKEEIKNVKGIGDATYEKIKDLIEI
jgi:competence protein ComEA